MDRICGFVTLSIAYTGWSYGIVCVILRLAIFVELRLVTDGQMDRQTDRRTHDDNIYRASIASRCKMGNMTLIKLCHFKAITWYCLPVLNIWRLFNRPRDVKEDSIHKIGIIWSYWRQLRSSTMSSFDGRHTICYSPFTATMRRSCIVFEKYYLFARSEA